MKKISLTLLLILSLISLNCGNSIPNTKKTSSAPFAEIKFRTEEGVMGQIPAKGTSDYHFVFSNTGNSALMLTEARGSCHCVYTEWSKTPVNPGDSAVIKVTFDPEGIPGLFIRTITVRSNAKTDSLQLRISGEALAVPK